MSFGGKNCTGKTAEKDKCYTMIKKDIETCIFVPYAENP
jgi:hypothetical protein